jgi:hypothetical protein
MKNYHSIRKNLLLILTLRQETGSSATLTLAYMLRELLVLRVPKVTLVRDGVFTRHTLQ